MLTAAVVGLGIGEQHALAYLRAGCELRWVYDLSPAKMQEVLARLGSGQAAPGLDAVLDDPGVDVVSIASFDHAHAAEVVRALHAGKHVFVEKPLCRTLQELTDVQAAWRASGRVLRSNLVLRSAPLYRWLQDAIAAGEFGDIYAIDGDYLYGRLHKITEGWRSEVPDYSVLEGGGIHLIDLMVGALGERPDSVSTVGNKIASRDTAFRYHDFVAASFTFPSGAIGRITANFGCVHRHQHVFRVFGTKATFIYDDAGARLHRARVDGAPGDPLPLSGLPTSKGELIQPFLDRVSSGVGDPQQDQRDFDVIRACIAAEEALHRGGTLRIDYP